MEGVEIVSAHHERVVVRVGDTFVKVDTDPARLDVEVAAMTMAPVPTPAVRWHRPGVLALAALLGTSLGRLGEPSTASRRAWAAAGAAARRLHGAPLPVWPGWTLEKFHLHLDAGCRWLHDRSLLALVDIERNRRVAEAALRPWTPVFTHGDYQAAHVIVDGDRVSGIIDWSDACQGDALFDLAVLTVGHGEHLDAVIDGYGVDADVDRDVIRAWWALRRLLAVKWMDEHGFDPSGDIAVLTEPRRR